MVNREKAQARSDICPGVPTGAIPERVAAVGMDAVASGWAADFEALPRPASLALRFSVELAAGRAGAMVIYATAYSEERPGPRCWTSGSDSHRRR